MAVYEQTYKQYLGKLTPEWSRFLIIPRHAFRDVFKSRLFTAFFIVCFLPLLVEAILIYLHHNVNALALMKVNVRELIPIADPRPECHQESHLRLVIIDAGLPAPEPQVWVLDGTGRQAYRIDLAYRERRVGLEYDGRSHLTFDRLNADRSRMNWLSARRWAMRYFTARDLYQTPALIVAEVRALLS